MAKQIPWHWVMIGAALMLMVTVGARQSLGLYVAPIDTSTGLGIVTISLALAVGQFTWGAVQPIAGAVADRYGPGRVMAAGVLFLALGSALTTVATSGLALVVAIGLFSAGGAGAASYSVLMGAAARRIPSQHRAFASGFINAGGSFGQFMFAPVSQALIGAFSWITAMWVMAGAALAAAPLAFLLRGPAGAETAASLEMHDRGMGAAVKVAAADRSYWLLHAGFFTCGFHLAFLATHLPGEIDLCGMPATVASTALAIIGLANIFGSIIAGWGVSRYLSKHVLFFMYGSRGVLILLYLIAPKTEWTFYTFAAGLGLSWLGTVPPTVGVIGKLFGTRYLSTLFGLTLLSHQIGGFFGAWLGGISFNRFGDYSWMWYADAALAFTAAVLNLPIREPATLRTAVA